MALRMNPLKNKVIHADIKTQSIEEKSNRPERELANDSKLIEENETPEYVGYKKRAVEMQRWWDEAIALNKDLPSGYDHVAVLILKWSDELDARRSRAEADKAEAVFRDRFHFSTQILELDVFSKPQHQLHRCLSTFVEEHDGPNNLLIIFYTGDGQYRVDDKYLELTASLDPVVTIGGHRHDARCNWNKAEAILLSEDVECDVLAILDGCYSGKEKEKEKDNENENENEKKNEKKNEKEESRTFELLIPTNRFNFSFTRAFILALEYQTIRHGDRSFTTFDLSERIRSIHGAELSFRLQHGRHIHLAPLPQPLPRKSRNTNTPALSRLSHSTGSYLTLRFALDDESLNPRQIKHLAKNLPDVFLNRAHVSLRRIDWLGIKPARSTQFSRAALAVLAIIRWKKLVRRCREERLAQRPVDKELEGLPLLPLTGKRTRKEHDGLPGPKAKREYRAPIFMPSPLVEKDTGSNTNGERGLLWAKASEGYLYLNIRELIQDMDETSKRPSSLNIAFECHIPTVFPPTDTEASLKDKDIAEQLFNHVVLIKSPASDGLKLESNCSIKATTCREYMERQWPSIGVPLLEQISNFYIDASGFKSDFASYHDSILFPMMMDQNTIFVYINDPKFDQQLFDYLQALDWLCRAMRKQLSFGSKDHRISQSYCTTSLPVNSPSAELSLKFTLQDEFLPPVNHNCWQRLFHSCFVLEEETSQGSTPSSGKGLEMSFDLMVSLAAVEYPVIVNGGVVFVGYQTILIPTKVEPDYAQFHLEVDHNQQINPFTLQYGKRAPITDYSQLKSKRCFLGWCEVAHIRLGTQTLPTTVKYSASDEKKKSLYFSGVSAGFQCTSAAPIQAGLNGQATFSFRSHCLYFTPPTIYSKMLLDATRHVVLICDVSAQRSWLVPKLSLLIHMAHTWFRNNNPPQDGILSEDPIPFAEPHVGGAALPQQFEGHGDVVVCGGGTDAFRLRDLLLGFNINLLETKKLTEGSTNQYLYGFEFMDIISEPGKGAIMKKVKSRKSKNWLALANLVDAVVLCSDLGDAITPADCIARKNSFCNSLPVGADYLAAHVSCLVELANRRSQQLATPLPSPQIILSERNLWNIMGDPFGACDHDNASTNTCWDRADILQKVCGKDLFLLRYARIEKSACNGSLRLSLDGAVVFGR